MRRLADAGLTTREACGNSVRNITACPYAGVAADERFDVTPYAEALTRYLLRHPLSSTLPRKFKIAFEAVEQRGRNRHKALARVLIRNPANRLVHPKDLLHHYQRANRLLRGSRHIRAQFVPIVRRQLGPLPHNFAPVILRFQPCVL